MVEKVKNMTYAELPHSYDAWKHLATGGCLGHDFYEDDPEIFCGLSNGRRHDTVMARVYDSEFAELIGDHNAEKNRVRNRRKADRKHVADNWEQEKLNRKDRREEYGCRNWKRNNGHGKSCRWSSNAERKIVHAERGDRADWELDLRDLEWDISYAEFEKEICREGICDFNMEIQNLEYQLADVDILRDRLEYLRECRGKTECYLRISENVLREYVWVKEMM